MVGRVGTRCTNLRRLPIHGHDQVGAGWHLRPPVARANHGVVRGLLGIEGRRWQRSRSRPAAPRLLRELHRAATNAFPKRAKTISIHGYSKDFFFVLSAFFGREMHCATEVKCGFREGSGGGRKRGAHLETIAEGRDAAAATSVPSEGRTAADGNVGFGIWGFEHLLPRFYPARKQGRRNLPVLDAARRVRDCRGRVQGGVGPRRLEV